jgi:hypothetical protein
MDWFEKLLIGGSVATLGLLGKLFFDENKEREVENKRKEAEWEVENKRREAEREADRKRIEGARAEWEAERKRIEAERIRLLSKIVTSSNNLIKGYRILRHIRMVSVTDEAYKTIAEGKFLLAVEEAGGNGVINMQVRPHRGGYFSIQGDAVLIELV